MFVLIELVERCSENILQMLAVGVGQAILSSQYLTLPLIDVVYMHRDLFSALCLKIAAESKLPIYTLHRDVYFVFVR